MGVKNLWNILAPVGIKTSLYELQDKTVAVDISCWICENQAIGEKYVAAQPRMYLRTSVLLMMNITPIFVMDGEPPECKQDVISKRIEARFRQRNNVNENSIDMDEKRKKTKRSRLKGILKQCCDMLELMGLECIQSEGEAEALCALLNKEGIVDGVITEDGDAFLYGALTVYRNFTIHAGVGTVDVFQICDIESKLNLTREKLIAMSLLCGCDYNSKGVLGVGKETALKFLEAYNGENVLNRLQDWRNDKLLDKYENEKLNCTKCSHSGKLRDHSKFGCEDCRMNQGCLEDTSPFSFKNFNDEKKQKIAIELNLRRKALTNSTFPDVKTMNEFLKNNQVLPKVRKCCMKPLVVKFVHFTYKMLDWEKSYGLEKIIPLLTRWELANGVFNDLIPESIIKKRVIKGVPSYEVSWSSRDENINSLICLLENEENNMVQEGVIVTTEPQTLIVQNCKQLHNTYLKNLEQMKQKKSKKKTEELFQINEGKNEIVKGKSKNLKRTKNVNIIGKIIEGEMKTKKNSKLYEQCQIRNEVQEDAKTEGEAFYEDDFTNRIKKLVAKSEMERLARPLLELNCSSTTSFNESDKEINKRFESYSLNEILQVNPADFENSDLENVGVNLQSLNLSSNILHINLNYNDNEVENIDKEDASDNIDRMKSIRNKFLNDTVEIADSEASVSFNFKTITNSTFENSQSNNDFDLNDSRTQDYDPDGDYNLSMIVNTIVSRSHF